MNDNEIRQTMSKYKFYHVIQLTDNIATPGHAAYTPTQDLCMKYVKSLDLTGKRVLDIGCRDGLFSFAAEKMGAAEVVGIDNNVSKPATEFLIPFFNSRIGMHQINLYDLKPDTFGLFDVVIFPGVLYHLRYPFWGLKVIRDVLKVGGHFVIETPIWEGEPNNAVLFCPIGGESPYEPTSCTFFNEKGLVDTLKSMGFKTHEIEYLEKSVHHSFKGRVRARLKAFVDSQTAPPPITKAKVNRSVFHSIFTGYEKDSFIMKYWEATHDHHTQYGA